MKSISAKQVFRRFSHPKSILWNKELWSDEYFVRIVEDKVTAEAIKRYIQYQHRAVQLEFDL